MIFLKRMNVNLYKLIDLIWIDTYQLVCITSRESGLPFDIWLDARENKAEPYILIRRKNRWKKLYYKKILDGPDTKIKEFININYDILISHWNIVLSDRETLNKIMSV